MKRRQFIILTPIVTGLLLLPACGSPDPERQAEAERQAVPQPEPEKAEPGGVPQTYRVRFDTSKGPFIIEVDRAWAPLGAARFHELVESGFYNGARFFRVVPNFVVQFGLAANPADSRKWDKPFKDDEVLRTNRTGSVAFATMGPNTRTTQVFINLRTNQSLDEQGFAPFGQVVEGMEVVERLYSGYGEAPDQGAIRTRGNQYLNERFPNLDYIKTATIL